VGLSHACRPITSGPPATILSLLWLFLGGLARIMHTICQHESEEVRKAMRPHGFRSALMGGLAKQTASQGRLPAASQRHSLPPYS
jgi:hypothetical protein